MCYYVHSSSYAVYNVSSQTVVFKTLKMHPDQLRRERERRERQRQFQHRAQPTTRNVNTGNSHARNVNLTERQVHLLATASCHAALMKNL